MNISSAANRFCLLKALQIGERELKKLRLEVKSLQRECQQGKTLIKSLTQVKAEKAALEEKVGTRLCSTAVLFGLVDAVSLNIANNIETQVLLVNFKLQLL